MESFFLCLHICFWGQRIKWNHFVKKSVPSYVANFEKSKMIESFCDIIMPYKNVYSENQIQFVGIV